MVQDTIQRRWSSRYGYMLAATGSAVGLGNIWKFPYIMGENGGGAFIVVYLLCILFIGIPVMMAEVVIGKRGRQPPAASFRLIAHEAGASPRWAGTGWFGVLAGYLVLSFYVVIAGWALAYVWFSGSGQFGQGDTATVSALFADLIADPLKLAFFSTTILLGTVVVIGRGVNAGLERAVELMMPVLILMLLVMAAYAGWVGDFQGAFDFMFVADFSKLTLHGVVTALGHSFFTLSLASGIVVMFGAYLPTGVSVVKTSIYIAIADTLVALLAGLVIFPVVFGYGLAPSAGPGLIFQTLPIVFSQMPGGYFFGTAFFTMLVFAAFTSSLAFMEASVAWLEGRFAFRRMQAAFVSGTVLWLLSLLTIFSFAGAEWTKLDLSWLGGGQANIFETIDFLTANVMLPLGGLLIALFGAWIMTKQASREEMATNSIIYNIWLFSLRYVAPVAITVVFLQLVGIIQL